MLASQSVASSQPRRATRRLYASPTATTAPSVPSSFPIDPVVIMSLAIMVTDILIALPITLVLLMVNLIRKCCSLSPLSHLFAGNATQDAKACIAIIDGSPADPSTSLLCKNLWRLARALHYSNESNKEEIGSTLQRLADMSDDSFSPKAGKMLEQLTYYDRSCSENGGESMTNFEPMPIRGSFQYPYHEYYAFGHDYSESLLRHESIESQSIHLKDLNDEELSSLSFLFGGVGDARHVMATLLDAHNQYNSLPSSKQEKFHLHCTLNDISAQLLAKDTLMLVLAHEMGRLAGNFETAQNEKEPFFLGVVIMYATMGHAMPACVHKKLMECIKQYFTESSRDEFIKTFPWLHISDQTWEGILTNMKAWLDPDNAYSPKLSSVEMTLLKLEPSDGSSGEAMSNLSSMGASSDMMSNMGTRIAKAKESKDQRRLEMLEMMRNMELTPDMTDAAKATLGEDATEEQMREFVTDLMSNAPHEVMTGDLACQIYIKDFDKMFMKVTHALAPPTLTPVYELNEEVAPLLGYTFQSKTRAMMAIEHFLPTMHRTWVVNPIKTDPFYFTFLNGEVDPDGTNYVTDFASKFLNESSISYMSEPPPCSVTADDPDEAYYSNTFARNVIRYYWNVGKVLNDLSGKISLEIDLGSIIALTANSEDRESVDLPATYQRISLSNIPDYTGMLSVFCTIAPLLASKSDSINPSLRSNCLLNTSMWETYDDYIFSTVSLSHKEAEAIFRLKVTDEEPSVWNPFTTWERADSTDGLPLTHVELRAWLHRLYLAIILPPDRDVSSQLREERPSSVAFFLMTLSMCIQDLGVPAHFISSILEDLLATKTLTTKATLSNDSPASILSRNNSSKKRYNLSAFRTELANQTAMFMQKEMLGVKVLSTKSLPVASASLYELKLRGMGSRFSEDWTMRYGARPSSSAMGFMLQIERGPKYDLSSGAIDGDFNPRLMFFAMMSEGGGMPSAKKKDSKLRKALLNSGDAIGHVFSCMQWSLETQTASFWMCDDLFEKFKGYAFTLIRTDGWFQMPHNEVVLGDAKRSNYN